MIPPKRKRAQVSYAEDNEELYEDAYGVNMCDPDPYNVKSNDDGAEDDSCKKGTKQKTSPKKRVKFVETRVSKQKKSFPFLNLPPELRDYIYELSLTAPEGLTLVSKTKSFRRTVGRGLVYDPELTLGYHTGRGTIISPAEQWNQLIPNLLGVSKQVHSEAVGYLYKQPIILEDTMAMHTFLTGIGQSNRLVLSDVVVKDWGCGRGVHKAMNVAALSLLSTCTNLQKLHFDCQIGDRRIPKHLARQIFRDGHYFLEAFGAVHGKKDAAVDILQLKDCNFESYISPQEPAKFKHQFQEELRKLLLT